MLASLIVLLRDAAAEGRQSQGFTAKSRGARAGQMSGGVAVDKEGKRLKELCSVALQVSYLLFVRILQSHAVKF